MTTGTIFLSASWMPLKVSRKATLVWREIIAWPKIVFAHKPMLPPHPKSLLKKIFILFFWLKILLSRLWHKKTLQIHSNLIFNLHHQEEARTRGFPPPLAASLPSIGSAEKFGIWRGAARISLQKKCLQTVCSLLFACFTCEFKNIWHVLQQVAFL